MTRSKNLRSFIFMFTLALVALGCAPAQASVARTALNPITLLPPRVKRTFTCIIWRESRSTWGHLNLGDNSRTGSSGIFQIEPSLWDEWRGKVRVPVWRATVQQQEQVATQIWRHDGFAPWRDDGCV